MEFEGMREVRAGRHVLTFDGRVLEVFNGSDGSVRVHVARMRLKVSEGRKGRLVVEVTAERRNTPRAVFDVDAEERAAFEPFIAQVRAAAAAAEHDGL